jgi:hypothetical protein
MTDDAIREAVARALFGPLNPIWDARWDALHESDYTYVNWSDDLQGGKQGYRHDAEIAIAAYETAKAATSDPFGRTATDLRENEEVIAASLSGAQWTPEDIANAEAKAARWAEHFGGTQATEPSADVLKVITKGNGCSPIYSICSKWPPRDCCCTRSVDRLVRARAEERERCETKLREIIDDGTYLRQVLYERAIAAIRNLS